MVAFEEFTGISPVFTGSRNSLGATRQGWIYWADINTFYAQLFPIPIAGIPQLPARFPGSAYLYVDSVEYSPFFDEDAPLSDGGDSAGSTGLVYERAKVKINYKSLNLSQPNPSSDQIVSRRWSIGGQALTLPGTALKFYGVTDPDDIADGKHLLSPDQNGHMLVGTIDHEITLHRVPSVPWTTIRSLMGKVNNGTWEGAPEDTLLFTGCEVQQVVTTGGAEPYNVTLRFQQRAIDGDDTIGWQHIFDAKYNGGTWRKVVRANGDPLYAQGNFDLLF